MSHFSQELIIRILRDNGCVFEKIQYDLKVSELINMHKEEKIYIPEEEYQRPFSEVTQQFIEIVSDIKNNRMNQSLSLIDHKEQIEYLRGLLLLGRDTEKIIEEIKRYEDLCSVGHLYSLVDGQHRMNYLVMFLSCINRYNLYDEYSDIIDNFLDIELPTYFVWGGREKDFIEFFRSINTSSKVSTSVIVWGVESQFNLDLKSLVHDFDLDYISKGSPEEILRDNYKILYSILKVCGSHARGKLCSSSLNKPSLLRWVDESDMRDYQYIIDLYDDYVRIFNKLQNISGKYVIYNLYFILHELSVRNIVLDDDKVKDIVYISNNEIHNQSAISSKYSETINQVTKFLTNEDNNETMENALAKVA